MLFRSRSAGVLLSVCGALSIGVIVGRATGIPLPEGLIERGMRPDSRCLYGVLEWIGTRTKDGHLVRAFTDPAGRRGFKLIRGVFRAPAGYEASRVVSGNGVAVYFHTNGSLTKLEMYGGGLPTGLSMLLSEAGTVFHLGFAEWPSGRLVSWRFSDQGLLESAEVRTRSGDTLLYRKFDGQGRVIYEWGQDGERVQALPGTPNP